MTQERVSREELRCLHIGQTRIFHLTDRKKIASARVQATQLGQEEGMKFSVRPDWEASAVSITRIS